MSPQVKVRPGAWTDLPADSELNERRTTFRS